MVDDNAAAEEAVDAFVEEVGRRRAEFDGPLTSDGYRHGAAAGLLLRGLELLAAARACPGSTAGPARELVLRSGLEVALRGRFLLGPDGLDELGRMLGYLMESGAKKAKALDTTFGGASPEFFAAVPIPKVQAAESPCGPTPMPAATKAKPTRDLASIAEAIDKMAGLTPEDRGSAVSAYRILYAPLSDSATHAGLAAVRRFVEQRNGRVAMVEKPEPLTTGQRQYLIVAGLLGDLAREVFAAFEVATDDLDAIGVRWVTPEPKPRRDAT